MCPGLLFGLKTGPASMLRVLALCALGAGASAQGTWGKPLRFREVSRSLVMVHVATCRMRAVDTGGLLAAGRAERQPPGITRLSRERRCV